MYSPVWFLYRTLDFFFWDQVHILIVLDTYILLVSVYWGHNFYLNKIEATAIRSNLHNINHIMNVSIHDINMWLIFIILFTSYDLRVNLNNYSKLTLFKM